jgi:uncharacterized membrane protein YfcA
MQQKAVLTTISIFVIILIGSWLSESLYRLVFENYIGPLLALACVLQFFFHDRPRPPRDFSQPFGHEDE